MRSSFHLFWASSLSLTLLSACQMSPASVAVMPEDRPAQAISQAVSQELSQGTVRVHILSTAPQAFSTQALNAQAAAYVLAEITGPGIEAPIRPTGADTQGLLPLNTSNPVAQFAQVPYGPARQISLRFYTAEKQALAGAHVQGVLHVFSDLAEGEATFRTTPTAQIMALLWPSLAGTSQATTFNIQALQAEIDQWTGWTSQSGYHYTEHPTLLNVNAIANALTQANFDIEAVTFDPTFVQTAATVSGTLEGLAFGDTARLSLEDPSSLAFESAENGAFQFSQVLPGTWRLTPTWQNPLLTGAIHNAQDQPYGAPDLTLSPGQNVNVGVLRYTYPQPVLTQATLSQNTGRKTLTVSGSAFHPTAQAHQVLIDGQGVAVARQKLADQQLKLSLPPGLAAGTHQLQLQVGTAVSAPIDFTLNQAEPERFMLFVAPVNGYRRVHRIKLDGTGLQQLTTAPAGQETQPALSPDGTRFIYRYSTCHCSGAFRVADILNEPNANPTELIPAQGQRYEYLPQWSPDGTQITFHSNRAGGTVSQIYTMNANGSQIQRVNQSNEESTAPTWNSEGEIVFSGTYNTGAEVDLQQISPAGTNLRFVTETTGVNAAKEQAPRYAPDFSQLAYTVEDPQTASRYRLYVKDLSTGQTRLVSDDIKNPVVAWQDASTLVFERFSVAGIYRIQTDGSGLAAFPGLPSGAENPAF